MHRIKIWLFGCRIIEVINIMDNFWSWDVYFAPIIELVFEAPYGTASGVRVNTTS
jgi:hypothetical protein